jgi:hypothetical protein
MAGRVVRPCPEHGKRDAVLVDLCGSVLVHGTLDMEREYSLDGRGVGTADRLAIRQCAACGAVFEAGPRACSTCGAAVTEKPRQAPRSARTGVEEVGDLRARRGATLRRNLDAVAAARGFAPAWAERAAAAIGERRLPWR